MTINEAIIFFKKQLAGPCGPIERSTFESFYGMLSDLLEKDLTEEQFTTIENELKFLDAEILPHEKKHFFSNKLTSFKAYLKKTYNFTTVGYYQTIGMSLGMGLGMCAGVIFDVALGMLFGMSIGMSLGIFLGMIKDNEAKKKGLLLRTTLS